MVYSLLGFVNLFLIVLEIGLKCTMIENKNDYKSNIRWIMPIIENEEKCGPE